MKPYKSPQQHFRISAESQGSGEAAGGHWVATAQEERNLQSLETRSELILANSEFDLGCLF